ncbi:hypothetical protein PV325_005795 [Microctonus aethiopoides]|uniref:Cyclic AMP-dependent transcription factor ATF-2 n=1 Tax=Microctonus aethiopoides TaxID=144406 RepID=A0AA39C6U1_9HYME|nr:hypothetical protein PV325_005795 [Microctonus aethiopoides]KAK0096987.1 hypothetical protein PV326_003673 [Microctonus aethiopoides]KAK0158946.1 hypothetical protein PV328_009881 [Microctonus aethiopoides]
MADSKKPFACSSPGCNMSFTNEDHLVVHKKKHDMILNLETGGNKNGAFVADQTPTPTRFIRNCEEVGLFQDLQNVNPFEETFRRAVESGKLGALPDNELDINDDTLHTPHVFLHTEDELSSCSAADNGIEVMDHTLKNENDTSKKCIKKSEAIVIQEADTSIVPSVLMSTSNLSINGDVEIYLKTQDGSMVQLSAVPIFNKSPSKNDDNCNNQTLESKSQTIVLKTALKLKNSETMEIKNSSSSRLSLAKMRLRQTLTKHDTKVKSHRVSQNSKSINEKIIKSAINKNVNNEDVSKKQEILERNRASSMRARAKRKQWIEQLEKTVKNVNTINASLQMEINSLQMEMTKLKTILMAHKDCPVTKAMEKGNSIIVKSKIIPVQTSELIQATSIQSNNSAIHGIKRNLINNDIPIVAKKPLILPTKKIKQSILLPKTDDKLLPMMTKIYHKSPNIAMMKLIDFTNISDNKETKVVKPILIMQNNNNCNNRKIQVINSQEIVNVDQSLQLINVASKTTGT